jgi:hypothetical protein
MKKIVLTVCICFLGLSSQASYLEEQNAEGVLAIDHSIAIDDHSDDQLIDDSNEVAFWNDRSEREFHREQELDSRFEDRWREILLNQIYTKKVVGVLGTIGLLGMILAWGFYIEHIEAVAINNSQVQQKS